MSVACRCWRIDVVRGLAAEVRDIIITRIRMTAPNLALERHGHWGHFRTIAFLIFSGFDGEKKHSSKEILRKYIFHSILRKSTKLKVLWKKKMNKIVKQNVDIKFGQRLFSKDTENIIFIIMKRFWTESTKKTLLNENGLKAGVGRGFRQLAYH